jgi:hypothetical protein
MKHELVGAGAHGESWSLGAGKNQLRSPDLQLTPSLALLVMQMRGINSPVPR